MALPQIMKLYQPVYYCCALFTYLFCFSFYLEIVYVIQTVFLTANMTNMTFFHCFTSLTTESISHVSICNPYHINLPRSFT